MKYTFNANNFFKYSKYGSHHYFKGYTILKNKFLIIGIDNNILIFDILSEKLLKRYIILLEEARKCYYSYKIFDDNSDESIKARNYYLTLIYHDSSKSKNDLGSYLDCTKSQTVSLTDLKITKEEKEKFQKDSTYIIF